MGKLKIAITGSTGLVGKATVNYFQSQGHNVYRLIRPSTHVPMLPNDIKWDVISQTVELEKLEGMDVVIHLAGASIAEKRWTPAYKKEIFDSRVLGTTFLCGMLYKLRNPPKVLLSASAVGYYGTHHQNEPLYETTPAGDDFLAKVCQEWEMATKGAELSGIRVVNMRFGCVLSKDAGALGKMLPIFKMGLGGNLGSGHQVFSWISVEDIPPAMLHIIEKAPHLKGAVNFVSPHSVTNQEFTKSVGNAVNRPTPFPALPFMLRMVMGEMADALLLSSQNVIPQRLTESGYVFKYPTIDKALQEIIR